MKSAYVSSVIFKYFSSFNIVTPKTSLSTIIHIVLGYQILTDIQNIRSCHETNFLLTLGGYNNHGAAKILAFKKHTVKQISSF